MSLSFKQNWSSMLLPFAVGVVLTALAFSFSGSASTQESVGDFQGDFRNPIAQNAPVACNTTNCQLMTKLNQMHGRNGSSTWTLDAIGGQVLQQVSYVGQYINDARGYYANGQLSSWNLLALAQLTSQKVDDSTNNIRGNSSWTLQALASQIWNACQN